jgi:hypothetical protein
VHDQAEILADDPKNLYLFKNIQYIHKKAAGQDDFRQKLELTYKVKNKKKVEESKDDSNNMYKIVQDWQRKSELKITLTFVKVWFPLLISTGDCEAKRKIPGYHTSVTIT